MIDENKKKKVTVFCFGATEKEIDRLEKVFSETIDTYLEAKGINVNQNEKGCD